VTVHTNEAHECVVCDEYERYDARTGQPDTPEPWIDAKGELRWMHWFCAQQESWVVS
jgi:hypothetical protein